MKINPILEKITMRITMGKHAMVLYNLLKLLIYHHENHDNHYFGEKLPNIFSVENLPYKFTIWG